LNEKALAYVGPQAMPNAADAVAAARDPYDRMEQLHTAFFDPGSQGVIAGSEIIAERAQSDEVKENVTTTGRAIGGAFDMKERADRGGGDETMSSNERFLQEDFAKGYAVIPGLKGPIDWINQKRDQCASAQQTYTQIVGVTTEAFSKASDRLARSRFGSGLRALFGSATPGPGDDQ